MRSVRLNQAFKLKWFILATMEVVLFPEWHIIRKMSNAILSESVL